MRVASSLRFLTAFVAMVAFSGPPVSGQAEIDPDHFESPNVEPFENAKTNASGKVAPVDYGHKVDAPYALLTPGGFLERTRNPKNRNTFLFALAIRLARTQIFLPL